MMELLIYRCLMTILFFLVCGIAQAKEACDDLTAAGPAVKSYATKLKEEILRKSTSEERLLYLLNSIHVRDRIDANKPDLQIIGAIAEKFGAKEISSGSSFSDLLKKFGKAAETNAETYRQIHNSYGIKGVPSVFFGPTAEDVVRLKIAFGCSHYARALKALILETGTLESSDVRYVTALSSADENKLCHSKNQDYMANGHQFLSVRIKGVWYYLNASSENLELIRQHSPFNKEEGEYVVFPSLSKWPDGGKVIVTQIEQIDRPVCDGSLDALRTIYRRACRHIVRE
jgi:hypothetical protein